MMALSLRNPPSEGLRRKALVFCANLPASFSNAFWSASAKGSAGAGRFFREPLLSFFFRESLPSLALREVLPSFFANEIYSREA